MKNLFYTFIILFSSFSFAQDENETKYNQYIQEAFDLLLAKDYRQSSNKFKAAFDQIDGKAYPNDRYNAACAYALANSPDTAFFHLFRLAESENVKYKDYRQITTDEDLNSLHSDERWSQLMSIVIANKDEYEKYFDKPVVAMLESIHEEDQKYRHKINEIEEKFGRESEEMESHWRLINEKDSINLLKVKKILDEKGWLGPNIIGYQGNSTLFLVIQHSDLETQLQYLPMMREAVELGNANPGSLALLEDRVALGQGKSQIYGSQIGRDMETGEYYVSPIINPEQVDERRAKVGLGPIAEYAAYFDIVWNLEEHIKRSLELNKEKETK